MLELLPRLYNEIWTPRVVVEEYQAKSPPDEPNLTQNSWLTIVDTVRINSSLPLLDAGEAAAISLAQTVDARLLLVDERKARRIAVQLGLPIAGTLAVLLRAKQQGHLVALRPYLIRMQAQGRRFHPDLIARVLSEAGE